MKQLSEMCFCIVSSGGLTAPIERNTEMCQTSDFQNAKKKRDGKTISLPNFLITDHSVAKLVC